MKATLDVFKMLNIEPGIYTMQICDNLSKQKQDKNIEVEVTSYEAGGF